MSDLEVLDDFDSRISYIPPSAWGATSIWSSFGVNNGTVHSSITFGSTVSLNFTGNYIAVTFFMYQAGANCTIYLDGTNVGDYNTGVADPTAQGPRTLFERNNLDPTQPHRVIIEHDVTGRGWVSQVPNQSTAILYIDSISIAANGASTTDAITSTQPTSVPEGSAVASPTPTNSAATSVKSGSTRSSTSAVVGGVLGAVAGALLLFTIVFFCLRKRKKKYLATISAYPMDESPLTASSTKNRSLQSLLPTSSPSGKKAMIHPGPVPLASSTSSSAVSPTNDPSMMEIRHSNMPLSTRYDSTSDSPNLVEPPTAPFPITPAPAKARINLSPHDSSSDQDLRREVQDLREEVRRLTALRSATPSVSGFTNLERPPEYVPRRSQDGSLTATGTS